MLELEPRASGMLGKHCTTELYPQPIFLFSSNHTTLDCSLRPIKFHPWSELLQLQGSSAISSNFPFDSELNYVLFFTAPYYLYMLTCVSSCILVLPRIRDWSYSFSRLSLSKQMHTDFGSMANGDLAFYDISTELVGLKMDLVCEHKSRM
jgi:hypothetical protein